MTQFVHLGNYWFNSKEFIDQIPGFPVVILETALRYTVNVKYFGNSQYIYLTIYLLLVNPAADKVLISTNI